MNAINKSVLVPILSIKAITRLSSPPTHLHPIIKDRFFTWTHTYTIIIYLLIILLAVVPLEHPSVAHLAVLLFYGCAVIVDSSCPICEDNHTLAMFYCCHLNSMSLLEVNWSIQQLDNQKQLESALPLTIKLVYQTMVDHAIMPVASLIHFCYFLCSVFLFVCSI